MRTAYEQRLFNAYRNFNQVAYNPRNEQHRRLAEQGIHIKNAFTSFRQFQQWVKDNLGDQPGPKYKIIRKNQLKGYTPKNLAWGLPEEVALELYRDKRIRYQGRSLNVCQWAKELGIPSTTIYSRVSMGYTQARDLLQPLKIIRTKHAG